MFLVCCHILKRYFRKYIYLELYVKRKEICEYPLLNIKLNLKMNYEFLLALIVLNNPSYACNTIKLLN